MAGWRTFILQAIANSQYLDVTKGSPSAQNMYKILRGLLIQVQLDVRHLKLWEPFDFLLRLHNLQQQQSQEINTVAYKRWSILKISRVTTWFGIIYAPVNVKPYLPRPRWGLVGVCKVESLNAPHPWGQCFWTNPLQIPTLQVGELTLKIFRTDLSRYYDDG